MTRGSTFLHSLLPAALLAAGCSSAPAPPAWQANAHQALNGFNSAYLAGNSRLADFEFARARAEIAKTGRADLLARAELIRCAAQVASLAFDDCPGYQAQAVDAAPAERAYADYLAARWTGIHPELLPAQHRAMLAAASRNDADDAVDALRRIDDPLARLIAAGVLLRGGRITPAGLALASQTASASGWPRPLLAWLGVSLQRAEAAGDREAAASLRRRIGLLSGGPAGKAEKTP
jgi:hypothetical protein